MRRWFYSGICYCGHSWEEHHLMMVMHQEAVDECLKMGQPTSVPGACEYYGCNEMEGLDSDGNLHCRGYVDRDEPQSKIPPTDR